MQTPPITTPRQTKYATAVLEVLYSLKHATNLVLLQRVQRVYPEVSATTIHRVTARLKERGVIGCAPKPTNGSERYDSNPKPHHHFMCVSCGRLCDLESTDEAKVVINQLKNLNEECALAGSLTLGGVCRRCFNKEELQI